MLKVGDKVTVIEDVCDDHREQSWKGWVGIIKEIWSPNKEGYAFYVPEDRLSFFVFFPKSRGTWRCFDFFDDELELVSST